ncbi:uncharacterized protein [Aegilops tauschii subsp. strangulata]|uniref:uncharacterized protein n=1 Tax=Aegilops tauschii subsp. strangulata TaxID=200361 RepID=UPI001ABCDB7F|nr:uncharacterized protein LOC120965456 [Aegilops tauschii subsp. strangulata]
MFQIRYTLKVLFGVQIITPESPHGTGAGKAFVSFKRGKSFVRTLEQDGLDLGDGHKLCVTKWLELLNLPWHGNKERGAFPAKEKERGEVNVQGSSTRHVQAANWLTPRRRKEDRVRGLSEVLTPHQQGIIKNDLQPYALKLS